VWLLLLQVQAAAQLLAPWRLQVLQVLLLQLPSADSLTAVASCLSHVRLACMFQLQPGSLGSVIYMMLAEMDKKPTLAHECSTIATVASASSNSGQVAGLAAG
jgi:hypothetical protein